MRAFIHAALIASCVVTPWLNELQAAEPTGWTTGGKKVLIIPVGFTDAPAPAGPTEGWSNLMTQTDLYYRHQSYGTLWMTGFAVCPTIEMGVSTTNYKPYADWKTSPFLPAVRARAKLAGYDPDDYDLEIVHAWITNADYGVGASALHGGKGTLFNYSNAEAKISMSTPHELGHNLGAYHTRGAASSSYLPGTEVAQNTKTEYWLAEYGSYFDLMGVADYNASGIGDFCAYYKNFLGWLPDSMVLTPSTSGVYRLHPFDQGTVTAGNWYALKINVDQNYTYWISLRQAVVSNVWSMNGVEVHWGGESVMSGGNVPYELDMTPGSAGYDEPGTRRATLPNMADSPLVLGRTFSDPNREVHITPVRKGGTTPESMDVVIHYGPFPGNRAPALSIAATTLTPATNQLVSFTATASDPDGDTLAYYWEFDDPGAPGGTGLKPFGTGTPDPDATLRNTASHAWVSNSVCLVRCTATDMKGGQTTAAATVTVGAGGGLTIRGVVKDELGNPVAGAVVNNNSGSLGVTFSASNFVASGATSTNGQYRIQVQNGTTNKIFAHHNGHTFICNTPGNSTTGTVIIAGASVTNVNFVRTNAMRIIGGPVYLAGAYPGYNPATHGTLTVHGGTNSVNVNSNGYWLMNVPEGPVHLTFTTQPGYSVSYAFRNPYEAVATHSNLALFVNVPGAVSSVSFASSNGTGPDAAGTVDIPIVLNRPDGYTNATWPMTVWYNGVVGSEGSARYGDDYRLLNMEMNFKNTSGIFTNFISMRLFSNGTPQSRTVVLKLMPNSFTANPGAITTYTYAIIPPAADGDADGIPDVWEWQFAGGLTNMTPAADTDADGANNLDEYLADTDPANPGSMLAIRAIQVLPGGVQVDWTGGSHAWQYLEYRNRLSDPADAWKPVFTNAPPTGTGTSHWHAGASTTSQFYRIRATR